MSRINIGGQAVMEGVMMRNNDRYAVAVRKPDKQIEVKTNRCTGTSDRPAVCNLPIVRGIQICTVAHYRRENTDVFGTVL